MSVPSLSRTSSTASVDSSDDAASSGTTSCRRTRKRFTNEQLTMLEDLFHKNSHPSREERETVANLGGMETKSVTIWFQNKRQMERKLALNNPIQNSRSHPQTSLPSTSRLSRPSLDCVASRSELPMPPPRTPSRRRDPNAAIWETMPSSPIGSPFNSLQREFVDFTKTNRSKLTLEWACAAARLDRHVSRPRRGSRVKIREREVEKLDLTDEDTDEAVTPTGTLAAGDIRWTVESGGGKSDIRRGTDDDDMMKAALMLCDLGRRPSHGNDLQRVTI